MSNFIFGGETVDEKAFQPDAIDLDIFSCHQATNQKLFKIAIFICATTNLKRWSECILCHSKHHQRFLNMPQLLRFSRCDVIVCVRLTKSQR